MIYYGQPGPLAEPVGSRQRSHDGLVENRRRVHDTGGVFDTAAALASARATGVSEKLRVSREKLTDAELVAWMAAKE